MNGSIAIDFHRTSQEEFTALFLATSKSGQISLAQSIGDCGLNPHQSQLARSLAKQQEDEDVRTALEAAAHAIDDMLLRMEE